MFQIEDHEQHKMDVSEDFQNEEIVITTRFTLEN